MPDDVLPGATATGSVPVAPSLEPALEAARVPTERMLVDPTPGIALNCCCRKFSARSCILVKGCLPEKMTVATPCWPSAS